MIHPHRWPGLFEGWTAALSEVGVDTYYYTPMGYELLLERYGMIWTGNFKYLRPEETKNLEPLTFPH